MTIDTVPCGTGSWLPSFLRGRPCSLSLIHIYAYSFLQRRAYIHDSSNHFTAAQFLNQLACSVHGIHRIIGIQAFLKFAGSIGTKADTLRGFADVGAVEAGSFKQD